MECRVPCRERDEARFNLNKRKNKKETKGENEEEEKKRYKRISTENEETVSLLAREDEKKITISPPFYFEIYIY